MRTQPIPRDGFVSVRGAEEHNLRDVDVDAPRDALTVFTGVSGSGKSSLAFGTIYAEAQRRGGATSRSSVGTVTTLSNSLRMLFSRAGTYPDAAEEVLDSDWFSPNTAIGACRECHGLGTVHHITERTLVPDPSLTIRERAVAAWPGAWQGQNLRDILVTLGYDIDKPWRKLSRKDRDWILFAGGTVVVVEHDLDVIASADWTIELGPGGGDAGGRIVATGPPAELAAAPGSRTGPYLARRLP